MRKKWVVCGSVYRNCHFLTAEISFLRRIRNYEFQESVLNGSESQKVRGNLASKSFCVKWGLQTNKLPSHNEHFLDFILPQHFFRPYDRNKMKMFCDPQRNISWVILEFWKLVKYLRALYTHSWFLLVKYQFKFWAIFETDAVLQYTRWHLLLPGKSKSGPRGL